MTEEPQVNNGIVMGGHARISDAAVAVGAGATAHHTASAPLYTEAVLAAVRELSQHLRDMERTPGNASIPPAQREQAQDEAAAIESELTGDQVDEGRLNRRLERLRSLVAGATSVLGLVTSAQEAIRAIAGG